jgi:hypothetical protein
MNSYRQSVCTYRYHHTLSTTRYAVGTRLRITFFKSHQNQKLHHLFDVYNLYTRRRDGRTDGGTDATGRDAAHCYRPILNMSAEPHWLISESKRWYSDSKRLVSKCTKPDFEGALFVPSCFISFLYIRARVRCFRTLGLRNEINARTKACTVGQ